MAELIARERIRPNDWNANAFDAEDYPKLVESIRQKGLMEPLKVTADPEREGHYLLVDGYHRWKAAGELGIEELPCEVWEIDLEEAKIRGLQLNYLRGQPVPERLAGLVHDLNRTLSLEDLAAMLPWSTRQLRDSLDLLRLPADLRDRLEAQAEEQAANTPIPVTVMMLPKELEFFEAAMNQARSDLGEAARRGRLLAQICRSYLAQNPAHDLTAPVGPGGESQPEARHSATAEVG